MASVETLADATNLFPEVFGETVAGYDPEGDSVLD